MDQNDKKKKMKYILIHGALFYGLPMFIVMSFIGNNIFEDGFSILLLIINLCIWLLAGIFFGFVLWKFTELRQKKKTKTNPILQKQIMRCKSRLYTVLLNLIVSPVIVLGPFIMVVYSYINNGLSGSMIKWLLLCLVSTFIGFNMIQNYHWVEIRGSNVVVQKFWTRRIIEHSIKDIDNIKGYKISFSNGDVITLIKYDMTNVDSFIALLREQIELEKI